MSDETDLLAGLGMAPPPDEPEAASPVLPALQSGGTETSATASGDAYVVLARRYRPQTFAEIVGQEQVQASLKQAIESGKVGHAYLFSGPRGTGKTSTARILAKALNCLDGGPRPDPCGRCESCRTITAGTSLDVIEIDAASNTGVDNIRDLRSGVALASFARYKVYIIDEVHMLSVAAFNALLKTLEEPPANVVFVLATTELQKVPETIVSRCQPFQFRRFSTDTIARQLDKILKKEQERRQIRIVEADRARILEMIARHSDGGMRDAQVALDQVLVLAGDQLDFPTVARFLGTVGLDLLERAVSHLHKKETGLLMALVEELISNGLDPERFTRNLVSFLRDLLLIKAAPGRGELLSMSAERLASLQSQADELPMSFLLNASSAFLQLLESMKSASQPRFLLELALIRLSTVDAVDDVDRIVTRLQQLESSLGGPGGPPRGAPTTVTAPSAQPAPEPRPRPERPAADKASVTIPPEGTAKPAPVEGRETPASSPVSQTSEEVKAYGSSTKQSPTSPSADEFIATLRRESEKVNHFLHLVLMETQLLQFGGGHVVLGVNAADRFACEHLGRRQNQDRLKELISRITGSAMTVRIQHLESAEPPSPRPDPQPSIDAAEQPADSAVEKDSDSGPARSARAKPQAAKVYRGKPLADLAGGMPELADLMGQIKRVFQVDDSSFAFRAVEGGTE